MQMKYKTKVWKPLQKENYRCVWNSEGLYGIIREFFRELRFCHQRIWKGYCSRDIYSIYDWFLGIMPAMLEEFRDDLHGCPEMPGSISQRLMVDEEDRESDAMQNWIAVLNRMIFLLRETEEETCSRKNPYEGEYFRAWEEFDQKYKPDQEEENQPKGRFGGRSKKIRCLHFPEEAEEYRELAGKYRNAETELAQYRMDCKNEAMELFSKWFYDLWD